MIWSKVKPLIPTLKETPADAEIKSHILMTRAGLIRKPTGGLYTYLPLCLNVIRKVEAIIRNEMTKKGAQELLMPFLQPKEIWEASGRWYDMGKEMVRIKNRLERDFVLAPTHEEVITALISKEISSYKNLPANYYQIQCKVRDEIRPRFGVIRAKEFIMKDAYSFHANTECLDKTFNDMYEAYTNIFNRCGLETLPVDADAGIMGGSASTEFMAIADSGEDEIVQCPSCKYAANTEKAQVTRPETQPPAPNPHPLKEIETPGKKTIEEVSEFLKIEAQDMIKTLFYRADDEDVCVLVCGADTVNEVKLKNYLKASEISLLGDEAVEKITGAPVGFAGPVGLNNIRIIADLQIRNIQKAATGANKKDAHFINVDINRDCKTNDQWEWQDIILITKEDLCPKCKKSKIEFKRGIELGHIFKLGTKYSEAMGAKFLDNQGKEHPMIMGCYGIGVSRLVAAIIEQHNDEAGIIWPKAVSPMDIHLIAVNTNDNEVMETSYKLYDDLQKQGYTVLLDDRNERPGFKFKDADLIGIPVRIIVSTKNLKEGLLEIKERKNGTTQKINKNELLTVIEKLYKEEK